jgi:hypothetical protein
VSITFNFSPSASGAASADSLSQTTQVWPPTTSTGASTTNIEATRQFTTTLGTPNLYRSFHVEGLLRFDTSSLPDGPSQPVISATLVIPRTVATVNETDCYLVIQWYDPGAVFDGADYTSIPHGGAFGTEGSSAATGVLATATPTSWTFTLSNLANINKSGFTGLRIFMAKSGATLGANAGAAAFPATSSTTTTSIRFNGPGAVLTVVVPDPPTVNLFGSLSFSGGFFESATSTVQLAGALTMTGALTVAKTVRVLLDGSLSFAGGLFTAAAITTPVKALLNVASKLSQRLRARSKISAILTVRPHD